MNHNTLGIPQDNIDEAHTSPQDMPRLIGGSALIHFENSEFEQKKPSDFSHLFPANAFPPELLSEAITVEQTEALIHKLDDEDPYKDYSTAQLALHCLHEDNDVEHAYKLLHAIHDTGAATHVLSAIVIYEDDRKSSQEVLNLPTHEALGKQLHEMATKAYENNPSLQTANWLIEASEAYPDNVDLRKQARNAVKNYPTAATVIDIE